VLSSRTGSGCGSGILPFPPRQSRARSRPRASSLVAKGSRQPRRHLNRCCQRSTASAMSGRRAPDRPRRARSRRYTDHDDGWGLVVFIGCLLSKSGITSRRQRAVTQLVRRLHGSHAGACSGGANGAGPEPDARSGRSGERRSDPAAEGDIRTILEHRHHRRQCSPARVPATAVYRPPSQDSGIISLMDSSG